LNIIVSLLKTLHPKSIMPNTRAGKTTSPSSAKCTTPKKKHQQQAKVPSPSSKNASPNGNRKPAPNGNRKPAPNGNLKTPPATSHG
jgi:hypothetical protein